tara:strand:- start:29 stop:316 length:288 start_codon:yes stop_codon:yes gene_type:complete
MKTIYISGRITGIENQAPFLFKAAERELIEQGWEVINPLTINHAENSEWIDYMRTDIKALVDCDAIFMLSNYTQSNGAIIELAIANMLKFKVIFQ